MGQVIAFRPKPDTAPPRERVSAFVQLHDTDPYYESHAVLNLPDKITTAQLELLVAVLMTRLRDEDADE